MRKRLPEWLQNRSLLGGQTNQVRHILSDFNLSTVCQSARCPNRGQCYSEGTATFMILGEVCTRNCGFCAVEHGTPRSPDLDEPRRIAAAISRMRLHHAVITSVTRDDLSDGGASHFTATVKTIKEQAPLISIEVLTPDFQGDITAIELVATAEPDIYNHNLETIPRLYEIVRPQAGYKRSLDLLCLVKSLNSEITTKSGIMVGLGEDFAEVGQVMDDLRQVDCDVLTIGQYLQPTRMHLPVVEYIRPERFQEWEKLAYQKGFKYVASGPLVRSSFQAGLFALRLR